VLEQLLQEGWTTAAACLLGALALLAGLRRAIQRTELALRDKLVVVLAAAGLTTAGVGSQLIERPGELADHALGAAAEHPFALAGAVFAIVLALVAMALVWWVRFWVRTLLRLAMLSVFLSALASWCLARFLLVGWLDGWTGLTLGAAGWRALLDGSDVTVLVLGVLWLLRARPPREKEL